MVAEDCILESFDDEGMARLLAGRLEAEGLSPRVVQYGMYFGQPGMGFHVMVSAGELEQAREIAGHDSSDELAEAAGGGDDADACPRCGSQGTVPAAPGFWERLVAAVAGRSPRERRRCVACGARRQGGPAEAVELPRWPHGRSGRV
jgi:hypothetical protein